MRIHAPAALAASVTNRSSVRWGHPLHPRGHCLLSLRQNKVVGCRYGIPASRTKRFHIPGNVEFQAEQDLRLHCINGYVHKLLSTLKAQSAG